MHNVAFSDDHRLMVGLIERVFGIFFTTAANRYIIDQNYELAINQRDQWLICIISNGRAMLVLDSGENQRVARFDCRSMLVAYRTFTFTVAIT